MRARARRRSAQRWLCVQHCTRRSAVSANARSNPWQVLGESAAYAFGVAKENAVPMVFFDLKEVVAIS